MSFQEDKEKEILADIKKLCERISQVNSFPGLVMYQSEIQRFYEDFIFLKKLNTLKGAKNFDPKEIELPPNVEGNNISDPSQMEGTVQKNGVKEEEDTDFLEIEKEETPKRSSTISNTGIQVEMPLPIPEKIGEKIEKKPILDKSIDYNFSIQSGKKHAPLQIDVNDNIAFLNYLFKGEKEEYETFIDSLNERNPVTSETFINHYIQLKGWGKKHEEYIIRLSELNQKRFE